MLYKGITFKQWSPRVCGSTVCRISDGNRDTCGSNVITREVPDEN